LQINRDTSDDFPAGPGPGGKRRIVTGGRGRMMRHGGGKKQLQRFRAVLPPVSGLSLFEVTFFAAAARARRNKSAFAAVRTTLVEPCLPQATAQGSKTLGAFFIKSRCCSGVSFTMPWSSSG